MSYPEKEAHGTPVTYTCAFIRHAAVLGNAGVLVLRATDGPESRLVSPRRELRFAARRGRTPAEATLEEMDALWTAAKMAEKVKFQE